MKDWHSLPLIKGLGRGSGVRFGIMEVLEENSGGLPEMSIHKHLRENGFTITQPAVSQNLAFLEKEGHVWKTRRYNQEARRELWYYISAMSFYHIVSENLRNEIALALSKSIEKNADRAPQFESAQKLWSFLEKIIQSTSESVSRSQELFSELSKRKPYGHLAPILREYQTIIANICEAIETHPRLHMYGERRVTLHLSGHLALSSPYEIARAILDGAIREEKKYLDTITFLHRSTKGELRERLEKSIDWIRSHSESCTKTELDLESPRKDRIAEN
jgi:Fe2+ or Zn2+ uptake regulation protein